MKITIHDIDNLHEFHRKQLEETRRSHVHSYGRSIPVIDLREQEIRLSTVEGLRDMFINASKNSAPPRHMTHVAPAGRTRLHKALNAGVGAVVLAAAALTLWLLYSLVGDAISVHAPKSAIPDMPEPAVYAPSGGRQLPPIGYTPAEYAKSF